MNYGHLGTGLPYAIGAKLAHPDKPVYCVTGDSAFGFNIQELETAVRNDLPVIIIVAVDGAFGMEKTAQQRMFGRQADWFGHEHAPVRYDQVAIAMGCHGEYVSKGSEIKSALQRSQSSGKPAVIHAVVDALLGAANAKGRDHLVQQNNGNNGTFSARNDIWCIPP